MENSQELVLRSGYMEISRFFIDKKRVGRPNLVNVFRTND